MIFTPSSVYFLRGSNPRNQHISMNLIQENLAALLRHFLRGQKIKCLKTKHLKIFYVRLQGLEPWTR